MTLQDRVRAFHEQFGFHVGTDPTQPPPDQIRYERAGLLAEEMGELLTELMVGQPVEMVRRVLGRFTGKVDFLIAANEQASYDPLRVMREAGDVHVGLLGLAVNGAFDLDRATAVVCESNLTRSGPDERGMAFKGEGFVAPDMRRALAARSPAGGCCTTCAGTGASYDPQTSGRCWDCLGTGHAHAGPCDPAASQTQPELVPVDLEGLPARVHNTLVREGLRTIEAVAGEDPAHLLEYRDLGSAALCEVRDMLGRHGYDLWWFAVVDAYQGGAQYGRLVSELIKARARRDGEEDGDA